MAWSDFYLQPTGNDLNSGSSSADAAAVTQTNGGWDTTTRVFTAASGTPFSAVVAGTDWVSIYNDGVTLGVFTALIDSVGGGGASITVSATARMGTQPTTSATGRSCKVGGAWASFTIATSSFFSAGTAGVPMRINVKAATYSSAAGRTFAASGTQANPIWIRGYNLTPGDMFENVTLVRPTFTLTTAGTFSVTGAYWRVSHMRFTVSANLTCVTTSSNGSIWEDCVMDARGGTGSNAIALNMGSAGNSQFIRCAFIGHPSANCVLNGATCVYIGCIFIGGVIGFTHGTSTPYLIGCIIAGQSSNGILGATGSPFHVLGNTVAATGASAYKVTNVSNTTIFLGNMFTGSGGYGMENATTAQNSWMRLYNFFSLNTSGVDNFGDMPPDPFQQTDTHAPLNNPAAFDYGLSPASPAKGAGFPGQFIDPGDLYLTVSAADIGAVQRPEAMPGYVTNRAKQELLTGVARMG